MSGRWWSLALAKPEKPVIARINFHRRKVSNLLILSCPLAGIRGKSRWQNRRKLRFVYIISGMSEADSISPQNCSMAGFSHIPAWTPQNLACPFEIQVVPVVHQGMSQWSDIRGCSSTKFRGFSTCGMVRRDWILALGHEIARGSGVSMWRVGYSWTYHYWTILRRNLPQSIANIHSRSLPMRNIRWLGVYQGDRVIVVVVSGRWIVLVGSMVVEIFESK